MGGAGRPIAGIFEVVETSVGSEIMFLLTGFFRLPMAEPERLVAAGEALPSCRPGGKGNVGVLTVEIAGERSRRGGVELAV